MKQNLNPQEFSLISLLHILKNEKRFLIIFIIIFTIVVMTFSFIMSYQFNSTASLLPPQKENSGGGLSSILQSVTGGLDFGKIGQSDQSKVFAHIISSRTVAEFISDSLHLRKSARFKDFTNQQMYEFIKQSLAVEIDKTGVVYISGIAETGFFPTEEKQLKAKKFSSELANYAVKGLDKVIRERSVSSARRSKEYVESQIILYRIKLDSVERALEVFQKNNNVLEIEEQTKAIVSQAVDVGTQLAKAELEFNLARTELQEKSPKLEFYRDQYELLKNQYQKIQNGGITNNETFNFPLNSVPKLIREYTDIFRQRKIYEQVLIYLETQRHQEAIQEKRDLPVVEVLDNAIPPDEKISPNRRMMVLLSITLSTIIGAIIIVIRSFKNGLLYLESIENNIKQ
jgi:uncharacterized protein involved in exopolysaccharide biosynthesis